MGNSYIPTNIDEYLRKRLMPVEGAIPQLPGIEMYGNSVPAGAVGGDLFEYINFQQRYDIDGRIQLALKRSQEYLEKLAVGASPRNSVDDHVNWLKSRPGFSSEKETGYREARSSEQVRVAEDLRELRSTAGVLLVDAEGHGIIAAKIASTVHDTFQALMLSELDHRGKTTPELFERMNLRLAQSSTARNALGRSLTDGVQEIATMLYGEIRPSGNFRLVNFGHPRHSSTLRNLAGSWNWTRTEWCSFFRSAYKSPKTTPIGTGISLWTIGSDGRNPRIWPSSRS